MPVPVGLLPIRPPGLPPLSRTRDPVPRCLGWLACRRPWSACSLFTPVATSGAVVGSGAPPMDPRFVMGLVFMRKNPWILIYATWHSRHGSAKAGMR